jgi:ABC-type transporter Mla subunit MlaD
VTSPEQHAATLRDSIEFFGSVIRSGETLTETVMAQESDAVAALDELVALASEAERLADSLRSELHARPPETDARDTYADGYTSGLIRALQIASRA